MNPEIKALWLAELRSGKYAQAKSALRHTGEDGNVSYCCLGVLCELALEAGVVTRNDDHIDSRYVGEGEEHGHLSSTAYLPSDVMEWAGLTTDDGQRPGVPAGVDRKPSLAGLNDQGSTFEEIADVIEAEF